MDYYVILIESGKPTHRWFYQSYKEALIQLACLLRAFVECNEVTATIVKAGCSDRSLSSSDLILTQIFN